MASKTQRISAQIAKLVQDRKAATGDAARSITDEIRLLQTNLRNAVR